MSFWRKKIKNAKDIADRTGIDEEKIKELKNGEREIGGETMEKVLNAINESDKETKLEKQVKQKEIKDWCYSNNILKLIREFGYESQKDAAESIGVSRAYLSTLINHKVPNYSPLMKKVYDFFHNDFNRKKIEKATTENKYGRATITTDKEEIKRIMDWFKKNKLKDVMKKHGIRTYQELAKKIHHAASCLSDLGQRPPKVLSQVPYDVYYFFMDLDKASNSSVDERKIEDRVNVPKDTKTVADEAKNDELEDVEAKEEQQKPKKKKLLKKYRCLKMKSVIDELQIRGMQDRINQLEKQNTKLKLQLKRYEKLIDNLK